MISPEGSAEPFIGALNDERIRYWKNPEPTGGFPAVIRNRLAEGARGKYLYFLDDDDRISPESLVAIFGEPNRARRRLPLQMFGHSAMI